LIAAIFLAAGSHSNTEPINDPIDQPTAITYAEVAR
jgi:hypothetical protein